jgi:hypothetical protein
MHAGGRVSAQPDGYTWYASHPHAVGVGGLTYLHALPANARDSFALRRSASHSCSHEALDGCAYAFPIANRFAVQDAYRGGSLAHANQDISAYAYSDPAEWVETHMHLPRGLDLLHRATGRHALQLGLSLWYDGLLSYASQLPDDAGYLCRPKALSARHFLCNAYAAAIHLWPASGLDLSLSRAAG